MSKKEHLRKLHVYRPTAVEAGDRSFDDALRAAERDPDLKAFLRKEQDFDHKIRKALIEIPVPADLRDRILNAAPGGAPNSPLPRLLRFPPLAMGIAAILLIAAVGLILDLNSPELSPGPAPSQIPIVQAPNSAVPLAVVLLQNSSAHRSPMEFYAQDYQQLSRFVEERGARPPVNLPREHWRNLGVGCRVVKVINNNISVITFEVDGDIYSLYTFDQSMIPQMQAMRKPHLVSIEDEVFATWTCSGQVHVLRTHAGSEKVSGLLDI